MPDPGFLVVTLERGGREIVAPMLRELAEDLDLDEAAGELLRIALARMFIQGAQAGLTELAAKLIEGGAPLYCDFQSFDMPIYPSREREEDDS